MGIYNKVPQNLTLNNPPNFPSLHIVHALLNPQTDQGILSFPQFFSHTQSFQPRDCQLQPLPHSHRPKWPPPPSSTSSGGFHLSLRRHLLHHDTSEDPLSKQSLEGRACPCSVSFLGAHSKVRDILCPSSGLPEQMRVHSAFEPYTSVLGIFLLSICHWGRFLGHCQLITVLGKSLSELANSSVT